MSDEQKAAAKLNKGKKEDLSFLDASLDPKKKGK
jgi:hypothetical protein